VAEPLARAERVRIQDVRPYDVPESLDDLVGPVHGLMVLPHHVHWGPKRHVDLDDEGDLLSAYQAIITEGRIEDQVGLLNKAVLKRVWNDLVLSRRVRSMWEQRLPSVVSER
jgi:hypothetical protein